MTVANLTAILVLEGQQSASPATAAQEEAWYTTVSAQHAKSRGWGTVTLSSPTRQKEHLAGLMAKKEDNALWKHQELHHPDRECSFVFEAERFFNEASSHQIYEGVCINSSSSNPGYLMNSRAEYDQGAVARVVVASGL